MKSSYNSSKASSAVREIKLKIEGMDCPSCALSLERSLSAKAPDIRVDFLSGILTARAGSLSEPELQKAVESLGYRALPVTGAARQTILSIPDMDCPVEEKIVRNALKPLGGVTEVNFNLIKKEVYVKHTGTVAEIIAVIQDGGLRAIPKIKGPKTEGRTVPTWKIWNLLGSALILGFGFLIEYWETSPLLHHTIFLLGIIIGGWQIGYKGWLAARKFRLDMNFLMSAAVVGAILIGQWGEAGAVVVLFALAQLLEAYSLERSRKAITGLMDLSPRYATIVSDDRETQVPVDEVVIGSIALVKPGERIPVDGVVKSGISSVNQASITGESQAATKKPGDTVYAGTLNQDGALKIETTHAPGDTTLDHIVHLVEEAQAQKAPSQSFVDKFSVIYTPAVVGMAVILALAPPLFFGGQWHEWIYRALALLVISCPCALVISTPVTIVSALANAARNGVLIKGGIYLENLHKTKAMAFDKTGTITLGCPEVKEVICLNDRSPADIIRLAASVESHSEHPIALSVRQYAIRQGIELMTPDDFKAIPGRGATAKIDGERIYIGNRVMFSEMGLEIDGLESSLTRVESDGSAILVGNEREIFGIIAISDTLKSNATEVISELRGLGITRIALLTGDNARIGQAIAAEIGLDETYTELLPEQKVAAIRKFRDEHGEVVMVGDGVNDAPALAAATIGIAMGGTGNDTTLETADITLMADDLAKIPWAIRLSKKAHGIIVQNIALSILIKIAFLILASAGLATLWMAVFADMGVSLMVIFNGMRALRSR